MKWSVKLDPRDMMLAGSPFMCYAYTLGKVVASPRASETV